MLITKIFINVYTFQRLLRCIESVIKMKCEISNNTPQRTRAWCLSPPPGRRQTPGASKHIATSR